MNYIELKYDVLSYYSGGKPKCSCCAEDHIEFLTIDHIHGRKSLGHGKAFNGDKLYRWIRNNDYPDGFQVLCLNCNIGRGHDPEGICPHKR